MAKLLPCPFCGATGEILSDGKREWALFEHKDSCLFPNIHKHEIPAYDFAAWNTRTFKAVYEDGNICRIVTDTDTYISERTCKNYDTDNDAYFTCSACESSSLTEFQHDGCDIPNYCPNCGAKVVE